MYLNGYPVSIRREPIGGSGIHAAKPAVLSSCDQIHILQLANSSLVIFRRSQRGTANAHSLATTVSSQWQSRRLVMTTHVRRIPNRIVELERTTLLFVFVAVVMLSLRPGFAQNCDQCATVPAVDSEISTSQWTFAKQVTEVNLVFLASRSGNGVPGLSKDDIAIQDDGKAPAAIVGFRNEQELPLRIAMLIDVSSSVTSRFRFEQAAAGIFLHEALQREDDLAFVMGFENHPILIQDFVHDPNLLSQGIYRLHPDGGTALYDAVRTACEKLQLRSQDGVVARVLVVLTDGQNDAGKATLEDAVDAAQQAEVTIYAISTNYSTSNLGTAENSSGEWGNNNLRRLAEQTGGRLLTPSDPKGMTKAFAKISEELRTRYSVSYTPADFITDGHYRKIKIEVRKAGQKVHIRARKGYYASPAFETPPGLKDAEGNLIIAAR